MKGQIIHGYMATNRIKEGKRRLLMGLQLTVRGSSEIWRLTVEFVAKHNGGEAEKSAVQSLSFQVDRREEGDFH